MMFKVVSLVLLFSVLLLGVTFTQNSYAAQHPFELKWGSSGLAKPGMFLNPQQPVSYTHLTLPTNREV